MVLKNIKEIKNIEKKIIGKFLHQDMSKWYRMFFLFLPVTISVLGITNFVRICMHLEERTRDDFHRLYVEVFYREICGNSSYSRENI